MVTTTLRLDVNINVETAAALERKASELGITVTELTRRAVSTYVFLHDMISGDNNSTVVALYDRAANTVTPVELPTY